MDSARYLDKLASLRFFAAFLVVLFHLGRTIEAQQAFVAIVATPIAAYGFVGVSIFFVLSGFVISLANERWRGAGAYLAGRVTRIYPPHLIVTFALFAPGVIALVASGTLDGWLQALTNLSLVQAWIPRTDYYRSLNLVTWSLSVEMSFYVAFIGLRHLNDRWLLAVTALAYLALLVFTLHLYHRWTFDIYWKLYINPIARMPEFLAGMSIYRLYRAGKLPRLWARSFNFPIILGAMLATMWLVGSVSATGSSFAATLDYTIVPLPFIVLLMIALLDEQSNPWMHWRGLVLLGESSFALYLLHRPLIGYLRDAFGIGPQSSIMIEGALLMAAVLVPVSVSIAFYKLIEVPITKTIRRLIPREA